MKHNEMIRMISKLNRKEFQFLKEILKNSKYKYTLDQLQEIDHLYAIKHLNMSTMLNSNIIPIDNLYKKEINRMEAIFTRRDIISRMGGLKIMLHGKTGTGKTYLVKRIQERNKNISFEFLSLEQIISSKMGQTQINLLSLAEKINMKKDKINIVFIDEIDSVVGSRITEDVGERKKIASTFIKFIDILNDDIIIIAATNHIDYIDDSIQRRFNIHITGKEFGVGKFIDYFAMISDEKLNRKRAKLENNIKKKFVISDIYSFYNYICIEKEFTNINLFAEFIIYFKLVDKILLKLSARTRKYIDRRLNNE